MSVTAGPPPAVAPVDIAPRAARPAPWGQTLRAVVAQGLRDRRRAALTWGGGLGAMSALMAALWPSIESSMTELMANYPSSIKEAFGISELDSVEKYVDAEMLSLVVPFAAVLYAVRAATQSTVGAEDRGYLDSLLALPLARRVLVGGAFIVTGVVLGQILGVMWALTFLVGTLAGTGISGTTLAAGFLNVWPLAMAFAGLAVLAAGVLRRPAVVTAIAAGTLVAMYVVDLLGRLVEGMEPLRALSAFRYYGSAIQDGLDLTHVLGLTLAGVALAALGALLFERRDIR